jgi:hypothetical protein
MMFDAQSQDRFAAIEVTRDCCGGGDSSDVRFREPRKCRKVLGLTYVTYPSVRWWDCRERSFGSPARSVPGRGSAGLEVKSIAVDADGARGVW